MKVSRDEKDGIVILRIKGRLIGGPDEADALGNHVKESIDSGKHHVLLDLNGVSMVNSTGIGILIVNYTRLRRSEGSLKLLNVAKRIQNVLYMTQLNTIFESYSDEAEALASFPQQS